MVLKHAFSSSAWGFVGEGSNVAPRASYNTNFPKVIVSRSHSGKVKSFVQVAFGNNTEIIPAGGAGTAFCKSSPFEKQKNAHYHSNVWGQHNFI